MSSHNLHRTNFFFRGKALSGAKAEPRIYGERYANEVDVGNEIVASAGHAVDPAVLRGAPLALLLLVAATPAADPDEGGWEAVLCGGVAADIVICTALGTSGAMAEPWIDSSKGEHYAKEGEVGNEIVANAGHAVDPAVLRGARRARLLLVAAAPTANPGEVGREAVLRGGVAADIVICTVLGTNLCVILLTFTLKCTFLCMGSRESRLPAPGGASSRDLL